MRESRIFYASAAGISYSGQMVVVDGSGLNAFLETLIDDGRLLGAERRTIGGVSNQWFWTNPHSRETDPLYGQQFWSAGTSGSAVGGNYANWAFNASQPNNAGPTMWLYGGSITASVGKWFDDASPSPSFQIGFFRSIYRNCAATKQRFCVLTRAVHINAPARQPVKAGI